MNSGALPLLGKFFLLPLFERGLSPVTPVWAKCWKLKLAGCCVHNHHVVTRRKIRASTTAEVITWLRLILNWAFPLPPLLPFLHLSFTPSHSLCKGHARIWSKIARLWFIFNHSLKLSNDPPKTKRISTYNCYELLQITFDPSQHWHTWAEMGLFVRTELLVRRPVQVNRQIGNSQDRPVDVNQPMVQLSLGRLD